MRDVVITEHAPQAIGPYSQAIKAGGFVFVSGQIPIDPDHRVDRAVGSCRSDRPGVAEPEGDPDRRRHIARQCREDHGISEEHGRLRCDERSLCALLEEGSSGALDGGSLAATQRCTRRDRRHRARVMCARDCVARTFLSACRGSRGAADLGCRFCSTDPAYNSASCPLLFATRYTSE